MNRIGGRSNTGEGGQDRRRYAPVKAGESLQSRLGKSRVEVDIPLVEGDSLKVGVPSRSVRRVDAHAVKRLGHLEESLDGDLLREVLLHFLLGEGVALYAQLFRRIGD